MASLKYQKCKKFAQRYFDLPDGAFFALAEEQGIDMDDWIEHAAQQEKLKKSSFCRT